MSSSGPGPTDFAKLYEENLPLIRRLAALQGARYPLRPEDIEDFTQEVCKKIWANDQSVLRQYQWRCTLAGYLAQVISKALKDHLDHLWGKWRSSAAAQQIGPIAVELERLMVRDHFSFDEACAILRSSGALTASDAELAAIAGSLPRRLGPRRSRHDSGGDAAGEAAANLPASENPLGGPPESAEARLLRLERAPKRRRVLAALDELLAELPDQDQLILQFIFRDGLTVAEISRQMNLDQKQLYSRVEKIKKSLAKSLRARGVADDDIEDIFRDAR